MTLRKSLIGELLVADALISPSQLEAALEQQQKLRERLCAILVSQGLLDWKTIHHWLAKCRGFACIDPAHYQINRELLKLVPGDFVRGHDVFPLDRFGNQLTVGMAVPLDTETIRELSEITGLRVKPVLCSMDEVRTAIARYYPACEETGPSVTVASGGPEDAGGTASLGKCAGELVRKIERLPALPDSVRRIGELLEQPDIEVNEAAAVIRRDAAITAKLLSVANSAAFSFKHQVKTVELAVALLGLRETYGIVMGFSIKELLTEAPAFDYMWLWNYSIFCANCATVLSKARGMLRTGEMYTMGLLHDIGRLVLAHVAGASYAVVDQNLDAYTLTAEELAAVGESHPEAGFLYAQHLGLPRDISEVIRYHHDLDYAENTQPHIATVQLSNILYRVCRGAQPLAEAQAESGPLLKLLGINPGMLNVVCDIVRNLGKT